MGWILFLIERKRSELNRLLEEHELTDDRVLCKSKEIDELIALEQRIRLYLNCIRLNKKIM